MVKLLTLLWLFNASQPAQSTLTTQTPQAEFAAPANPASSFTVKFTLDLKSFAGEKNILEIPHVLGVRLRQHDPRDRNRQNYPAFKMPDGSVPVLDANVVLHSLEHPDWKNMTIGIPLSLLKKPEGEHELVLNFCGVRWTMYVDGELLDNDFPFGYPQWPDRNTWKLDPEYVTTAAIYFPAITPEKKRANSLTANIAETTTFPADSRSFMLVFDVQPAEVKKRKVGISFLPESGEQASCELQIRLEDRRAQFGPGSANHFAGNGKSLREGGGPHAIEYLIGVDRPFTVRVIVKGDDKIGGSLIDAEIAGQRTMISFRPDLTVKKMVVRMEGVALKNVRIAPLKEVKGSRVSPSLGSPNGYL